MKIKNVGFFQAIKSAIAKTMETSKEQQKEKFDTAIKQILSKAVISDRIIDISKLLEYKNQMFQFCQKDFLVR